MRKLFWQIDVSLDGFMEGPNHELDYTAGVEDPDFDRYASAMLQSGRIVRARGTWTMGRRRWV